MTTHTSEVRIQDNEIQRPWPGNKTTLETDQRWLDYVRMWIFVGDLVILGLTFASILTILAYAPGKGSPKSVAWLANAPSSNVEPVISAWHSWEATTPPFGRPDRDEQGKQNPNVAMLTPNSYDVVAQMHQYEQNPKWTATLAVGSQKPS